MFGVRYFGNRMFAPRYFPKIGGAAPVAELPYQSDVYYYDQGGGTGSVNDGTVQPSETIYD